MNMIKGRVRIICIVSCFFTIIVLVYRSYSDDRVYQHQPLRPKQQPTPKSSSGDLQMYDLNELMPLTQPQENLEAMRKHEHKMMENVAKMIEYKSKMKNGGDSQLSLWGSYEKGSSRERSSVPVLQSRLVHLDLKGAPPRVSYFKQLFPFLRKIGATGLLLEYEDTFPYKGLVEVIRAYNSYTENDIYEILNAAEENNLEVIPLIQAFGHLEFVLKTEKFRNLREVPSYPQAICPSNNMSVVVLREIVDQVLNLHPRASYMHIGCDEVYNIGECSLCQDRLSKLNWNTNTLFLSHVTSIAQYVKTKHKVQPIMWDDMFRRVSEEDIMASEISKYTDILVWKYTSDVEGAISKEIFDKYAKCFNGIWIGSAFKGAESPVSFATPIEDRLMNHKSWVQLIQNYRHIPIKGIFLTGWQRYDHFSTLCELLPAGLPSLAVNLQFLASLSYDSSDARKVQTLLGCNREIPLSLDVSNTDINCMFPGSRIYELSLNLFSLNFYLDESFYKSNYITGWVSPFNIQNKFSSPALLEQATYRCNDGLRNFSLFRTSMIEALNVVYDNYTVNEWIDTLITPVLERLDAFQAAINSLLTQSTWPRRPVNWQPPENAQSLEK